MDIQKLMIWLLEFGVTKAVIARKTGIDLKVLDSILSSDEGTFHLTKTIRASHKKEEVA